MQFKIDYKAPALAPQFEVSHKILLVGSCFTENISTKLSERKISTLQNPHGILFNPVSIWGCLRDVIEAREYTEQHLFELHDAFHSWNHHSRFSGNTKEEALQKINESINVAHRYLQDANWLILTLGSAFAYRHNDLDMHVSNNHRAPAQWFTKELLGIHFIVENFKKILAKLQDFNPNLNVLFTISPVRHLRDGIVDNNRSKARLIEAVHQLVSEVPKCQYFPSYEIVIDELRDYRFFDIDFAHPNYQATEYVWQQFVQSAFGKKDQELLDQLYQVHLARKHRSQNPTGKPHQLFLQQQIEFCEQIQKENKQVDLTEEIAYFKSGLIV